MVQAVEDAGFVVDNVRDHRDALLTMRDQVTDRVEYERILLLLGDQGSQLLEAI